MKRLNVAYITIKEILATAPSYYVAQGDGGYHIYVVGENQVVTTSLSGTDVVDINDFTTTWISKCTPTISLDDALVLGNIANGIPFVHLRTPDGRPTLLPTLFPQTMQLCFPGAGDDQILGIGKGVAFQHQSNDGYATTHTVTWQFNDYVYLSGGHLVYQGAELGDSINYFVSAPATIVTTVSGTGNAFCIGPGNVLIIPGVNTNTNVNLSTAIPIPSLTNTGYWNWNPSSNNLGSGTITPAPTGNGAYNLYTIPITLSELIISYPIIGSNYIDFTVPAILPKKVLPQWVHQVQINNSGHTGLQVVWALTVARAITIGM